MLLDGVGVGVLLGVGVGFPVGFDRLLGREVGVELVGRVVGRAAVEEAFEDEDFFFGAGRDDECDCACECGRRVELDVGAGGVLWGEGPDEPVLSLGALFAACAMVEKNATTVTTVAVVKPIIAVQARPMTRPRRR